MVPNRVSNNALKFCLNWTVIVAQLLERSRSNPVIGKLYITHTQSTVLKRRKQKETGNSLIFKNALICVGTAKDS